MKKDLSPSTVVSELSTQGGHRAGARSFYRCERGTVTILLLFLLPFTYATLGMVWNTSRAATARIEAQTAADTAAYSSAVWMSRALNSTTASNMAALRAASAYTSYAVCDDVYPVLTAMATAKALYHGFTAGKYAKQALQLDKRAAQSLEIPVVGEAIAAGLAIASGWFWYLAAEEYIIFKTCCNVWDDLDTFHKRYHDSDIPTDLKNHLDTLGKIPEAWKSALESTSSSAAAPPPTPNFSPPPGSWSATAKNATVSGNLLRAELRKKDGKWVWAQTYFDSFNPGNFENDDGDFRYVGGGTPPSGVYVAPPPPGPVNPILAQLASIEDYYDCDIYLALVGNPDGGLELPIQEATWGDVSIPFAVRTFEDILAAGSWYQDGLNGTENGESPPKIQHWKNYKKGPPKSGYTLLKSCDQCFTKKANDPMAKYFFTKAPFPLKAETVYLAFYIAQMMARLAETDKVRASLTGNTYALSGATGVELEETPYLNLDQYTIIAVARKRSDNSHSQEPPLNPFQNMAPTVFGETTVNSIAYGVAEVGNPTDGTMYAIGGQTLMTALSAYPWRLWTDWGWQWQPRLTKATGSLAAPGTLPVLEALLSDLAIFEARGQEFSELVVH